MDNLIQVMMRLIRYEIMHEPLPETILKGLSDVTLTQIYQLSKAHDLAHLVGVALENNHLLSKEDKISKLFNHQIAKAVYRYEKINYEFNKICDVFEKAEIPFIPLKGSVIRQYYPQPWMRTSCDIDILIHETDLKKAIDCLQENTSFVREQDYAGYEVSLLSNANVHLELHFKLIGERSIGESINEINEKIWDNSIAAECESYRRVLTDEFFYFYHIEHMAKHIKNGGCGIRPLIDLWLLDNKFNNTERRDELLVQSGLIKFANAVRKLSLVWFEDVEHDQTTLKLQNYILNGGIYGNIENKVIVTGKNKFFSKIWKPYAQLKFWYPRLEKHKWLLPFYQIKRWFTIIFSGTAGTKLKENKIRKKVDQKIFLEHMELMKTLGL